MAGNSTNKANMKIKIISLLFITMLSIFYACEDIIDVELKDAEHQIVIDAKLYDNSFQGTIINISESMDYFGSFEYKTVSGAQVRILDENGTELTKVEETQENSGNYRSSFFGKAGHSYTLDVQYNNKTYTATAEMKSAIKIDTLYADTVPVFPYQEPGPYFLHCLTTNPVNQRDYMQFVLYINMKPMQTFYLYDDLLSDGNTLDYKYFEETPLPGDTVIVELRTMDKILYDYTYALSLASADGAGGPPTTPFNPESNISGGALGYFGVYAVDAKYLVLKDEFSQNKTTKQ